MCITKLGARVLCAGAFATWALHAVAAAPAPDVADTAVLQVPQYTVFVEPASRYAFIRIAGYGRTGWKFIGQIDARGMKHLPEGTLTSLTADPAQFARGKAGARRALVRPTLAEE